MLFWIISLLSTVLIFAIIYVYFVLKNQNVPSTLWFISKVWDLIKNKLKVDDKIVGWILIGIIVVLTWLLNMITAWLYTSSAQNQIMDNYKKWMQQYNETMKKFNK